ncbi:MAG: flagellar basal-body MS-ring/collar protein FliF [Acetivibrionales bacterium]|jgi:flagellar M-ring protein FliF
MPEFFSRLKQQVTDFWNNLEKSQKTRIIITSAVVIVAVAAGMILLTRPNYMTLIRNADPKEVGEMSSILSENNIWSRVENNGTSITINTKDNNAAQIALAQEGYPKGGMTFEDAISLISISTTESDKKHIWKQQKISDIAQKLEMLDNIEQATVNLAIPERSIFITSDNEQPKPTAYVMVKPKEKLTPKQVEGIIMIVSRSVEDLDPMDVTVVDNNSNILNTQSGDYFIDTANSQEELRLKRERDLEKKVYEYFSGGEFDSFDTLRVVANVVLDFDKEKSQIKSIANPDGMDEGAIISRETKSIELENAAQGGVPGMDTNPGNEGAPTYQIGEDGNSSYSEQHNIENFGYDETLSEREKATGKLMPDESSMAISLWYGKKVQNDSSLTDEFINEVRVAASLATGIPANNITVNKLKLAAPEIIEPSASERIRQLVSDYGFFAIIILLVIGFLIAALPRKKKEEEPELAVAADAAAMLSKFGVPEHEEISIPEIDLEERSEVKKQIEKFVRQKPESVAQLLRNWLSDEWDV